MKKLLRNIEDSMTAITFAEAGEAEIARAIMNETKPPKQVKKTRVKEKGGETLTEKHDRTMEAITFAEAGEHEYARELLKKDKKIEKKKLLIIGNEDGFSEMLINYALGMATRMNYDIAAVNVIPVGTRLYSFLNQKTRQELRGRAEKGAEPFRTKAEGRNVPFTHSVKFGEPDKVIKEVHKEFKRVSFVLSESEIVCDESSSRVSIPVFCLAD